MVFGCIGRVVTAAVLLIAGAALWHFRDTWVPKVQAYFEEMANKMNIDLPSVGAFTQDGARWVLRVPGEHS